MKIKITSKRLLQEELLTEAVENIIPPSMTVIIDYIKGLDMSRAAEDVYAKFIAEHGPKSDGRGKHWDPDYIGGVFHKVIRADTFYEKTPFTEQSIIDTAIEHLWVKNHTEKAKAESEAIRSGDQPRHGYGHH